jgi:hypothetical protein
LKKEIKDYRRWKDFPCSWIGRINIVKTTRLSKAIYMLSTIPIKIPKIFITDIEKSSLKFIWKHKRPNSQNSQILSKSSNTGGIPIPDFKLLQSHSSKSSMVLAQKQIKRPVEQNTRSR